eukprot:SAG11_NODE_17117_length_528_cov_0.899767_1_plen_103_part_10
MKEMEYSNPTSETFEDDDRRPPIQTSRNPMFSTHGDSPDSEPELVMPECLESEVGGNDSAIQLRNVVWVLRQEAESTSDAVAMEDMLREASEAEARMSKAKII